MHKNKDNAPEMSYNGVAYPSQKTQRSRCLMNTSIHHSETIFKMLKEINLTKQLSNIAITHIITILIAIFTSCASKKYQSKNKMFDTSQRLQRIKQFVDKQRKIISQHFVDQSGTKSTKSFGENSFGLKLL